MTSPSLCFVDHKTPLAQPGSVANDPWNAGSKNVSVDDRGRVKIAKEHFNCTLSNPRSCHV